MRKPTTRLCPPTPLPTQHLSPGRFHTLFQLTAQQAGRHHGCCTPAIRLPGQSPVPPCSPQACTVVSVRRVVPSSDVSTDTTDMAPSGSSSMVYVSSTIWPGSCILGIVLYKRWLWS